MSPVNRAEQIAETLRQKIVTWQLKPGEELREESVAALFGASRTPAREALALLRAQGLIAQSPGQIAVVSSIGPDDAIGLYQARDALESYAVQLAAMSSQRGQFSTLPAIYRDAASTVEQGDMSAAETIYAAGNDFDRILRSVVANPHLMTPLDSLAVMLSRLRQLARADSARLHQAALQRAEVASAIAAGDAESAGRANHTRLQASLDHALTALAARTAPYLPSPLA